MEYCNGGDLKTFLSSQSLNTNQISGVNVSKIRESMAQFIIK